MWADLIQKAKDGGLDAVETYIFWNAHEPIRRQVILLFSLLIITSTNLPTSTPFFFNGFKQYNFQGNLDFV